MRKMAVVMIATALCAMSSFAVGAEMKTATETIRDFYKRYLGFESSKAAKDPKPTIEMSKSFGDEIKKNADICAKYVSGPCGWDSDGDEYLDAQEIDPKLSFENAGIKIKEIEPGIVQVKLNVYPSAKGANGYYDRIITYKMVKENGSWVVDDMTASDGLSTRKRLSDENADAIANPDPDAGAAQKPAR
jgi:hypothetical protein